MKESVPLPPCALRPEALKCAPQATGVDVNVRFTDFDKFEFTDEVAIFDLLGIPLVHGWLVDPQASGSPPLLTLLSKPVARWPLCELRGSPER